MIGVERGLSASLGGGHRATASDHLTIEEVGDVREALRLSFFLSPRRVCVRLLELSESERGALTQRLARWQSVCGCSAATVALLSGVAYGILQRIGAFAIVVTGLLCAMAAKCIAIAIAYLAFRADLTKVVRASPAAPRSSAGG